jgi:outer membrane lipoprotein
MTILRLSAGINVPILRRIWIRFQSASMGAYLLYVPIDATRKTDSKTSKMGTFIPADSLALTIGIGSLILSLLWGCTVMSDQVKEEALPPIEFKALIKDVEKYKGDTVIVGGYVLSVENKSDHTRIVAVQAPLGVGERPKAKDLSQGRLILVHKGFIDPEVYTKDRQITVGGKISGSSTLTPKAPFPFLQLEVKDIHLWPIEKPASDPYWDDDFYPYYYPWRWHPYRHHHHWYH